MKDSTENERFVRKKSWHTRQKNILDTLNGKGIFYSGWMIIGPNTSVQTY
jgi:hypothetical protein